MKNSKKILSLLVASAVMSTPVMASDYIFSDSFMSNGYNSIGFERVDFKTSNEGSLGNLIMFSYKRGYDLSDYIQLVGSVAIPIDNEITGTFTETSYDSVMLNEETNEVVYSSSAPNVATYNNEIRPTMIADLGIKLSVPIHKSLTAYVSLGVSYARVTHRGTHAVDVNTGRTFDRLDFMPVPRVTSASEFAQYSQCELTGSLDACGYRLSESNRKFRNFGSSYAAGVQLNISQNNAFVLEYKKYNHDGVLNPEGLYLGYQWRF